MKRVIIIFILMAFISCRDKKNANNIATEPTPTDTEVAIATLKAFYSSAYNDSVHSRKVKIVLSDKGREKLFFNSKMLSNTITSEEGFRNISFENRFFTIEENTSTDPVQIKYTTFSIDYKTNEISLYKVEVSNIFNNASDDFDIIQTQKDFGKVSFENYDPETLKLF